MPILDSGLNTVFSILRQIGDAEATFGGLLRQAVDEVIDGGRSGRYDISQLAKTEKTYIGTKVEIILKDALGWKKGSKLDARLEGIEFDIKFSLTLGGWMIPREAVGELCLVIWLDDKRSMFGVGLVRANDHWLTKGGNQDGKRTLNTQGRKQIQWLILPTTGRLPENFLLNLDPAVRSRIFSLKSGQPRVRALFELVVGKVIPRKAIEILARQKDGLRRVRGELREHLRRKGLQLLCGNWKECRVHLERYGFQNLSSEDFVVIRTKEVVGYAKSRKPLMIPQDSHFSVAQPGEQQAELFQSQDPAGPKNSDGPTQLS